MTDFIDFSNQTTDAAREDKILQIFTLMQYGDERTDYQPMKLKHALEIAGIKPTTWRSWRQKGYLDSPMAKVQAEARNITMQTILPHWHKMVQNQVYIALGQSPPGTVGVQIRASDMRASFKIVAELAGLDKAEDTTADPDWSAIEDFQPKVIETVNVPPEYEYTGGGTTKMGDFPPVEIDDDQQSQNDDA